MCKYSKLQIVSDINHITHYKGGLLDLRKNDNEFMTTEITIEDDLTFKPKEP
jgi:hypothetical protein